MSRKRVSRYMLVLVVLGLISVAAPVGPSEAARPRDCRFVLCAYPDCLPGEHTVIPPGQCCPVCVPD